MGNRKSALIFVIVFSMAILFTQAASAAGGWYYCTVDFAGSADASIVNVRLTESGGAFSGMWFRARPGQEKLILATAMTALTAEKRVLVYADKDAASLSSRIVSVMYLCK